MGAPTTADKSPKPPRPPKSPIARQVHFADEKKDDSIKVTTAAEYAAKFNHNNNTAAKQPTATPVTSGAPATTTASETFTQPTSYPALGQFQPQQQQQQQPTTILPGGPGQWFTSANPAQSVNSWQQLGFGSGAAHPHQHPAHPHPHPHLTCPHHHQHLPHGPNMSYQNTAPPPHGVNFQPPVPDNSNGPMTHVYIPRFDGGLPQQPPFPQNQFMGAGGPPGVHVRPFFSTPYLYSMSAAPPPSTTLTSVLLPAKTYPYYYNGHVYYYYASLQDLAVLCFCFTRSGEPLLSLQALIRKWETR